MSEVYSDPCQISSDPCQSSDLFITCLSKISHLLFILSQLFIVPESPKESFSKATFNCFVDELNKCDSGISFDIRCKL